MQEHPTKGITEDKVRKIVELTQRVYDRRPQRDAVTRLLEPVTPDLVAFQSAAVALVEAVKQNPDQILFIHTWSLHQGETLQFALPIEGDKDNLIFCHADSIFSVFPWKSQLRRFSMVQAGAVDLETAKKFQLCPDHLEEPHWVNYNTSSLNDRKDVSNFQRGLYVVIDDRQGISELTYVIKDQKQFLADPALKRFSMPYNEKNLHPWAAHLSLETENITLVLHRVLPPGLRETRIHLGPTGFVYSHSGQTADFDIQEFVRASLSKWPIPTMRSS